MARCTATTAKGARCKNAAVAGKKCGVHGSMQSAKSQAAKGGTSTQAPRKKNQSKRSTTSTRPTRAQKAAAELAEAKAAFLVEFAKRGIVTSSARAIGKDRTTVYLWIANDEAFAAAFDDAKEQATDDMEDEARRRAVEGTERPVFQGGILVGYIREYSDSVLLKMLAANRPEKYRERMEVTGKGGGAIQHDFNFQSVDEAKAQIDALDAEFAGIVAGLAQDGIGGDGES